MAEKEPASFTQLDPPEPHDEPDGGKKRSKSKKPKQDPRLITDGELSPIHCTITSNNVIIRAK